MAAVRMVLYEDDSVQVQYADGSALQLSPCGSEFVFEKAPPASAHPLEQPERIRQRTHFVVSTYRERLQEALEFRNSYATCPFLSESIIPSEKQKHVFIDLAEVRWPRLDAADGLVSVQSGTVTVSSLDGRAYLCLQKAQQEFTVHFLCKVSQMPGPSRALSEKNNNKAPKDTLDEKPGTVCTYRNSSRRKPQNKENELCCRILQRADPLENRVAAAVRNEPSGATRTCLHTWVQQRWSVVTCPDEWKYPLSLALHFRRKSSSPCEPHAGGTRRSVSPSDGPEAKGREVSILPRVLFLSCPAPHLHRWIACDSLLQEEPDAAYSYPELVKVVWYKGITYRLTHDNVNSIEIYPGDGSVFRSEGAYLGNFFTYCYSREGSEEQEEKVYSVNNLPPDRPGSQFSVASLLRQATRILQHCARMRLSLSHNYCMCCWKMAPGTRDSIVLPLLWRESVIPGVGRFLAYSDDKVHTMFSDGVTLTLNWDFKSFTEKGQVNQGPSLGWCKLTFPDGHDEIIQIEHPGPHGSYVAAVVSWCRRLAHASARAASTCPSPLLEENWSVASELEKIKKFNLVLESSGLLNQLSNKKNERTYDYKPESSETLLEENEKNVSVALKKTSEILQDIDCLLSNSKK